MRVLVVEDSERMARALKQGLREEGYQPEVAGDGPSGLKLAQSGAFDLVLLDVNLPGLDGFGFMQALRRERNDVPVLMVTARDAVEDRVRGLDLGADDYLLKPFEFEELLARVRSLLRRPGPRATNVLAWDDLRLNLLAGKAERGGRTLELTAREFSLLRVLLAKAGEVVERAALVADVWGEAAAPESNVLEVTVNHLRLKLEAGGEPRVLHTLRNRGYLLGPEPRV
ncbi:MAG: response regulator transcription factor [Planctomycetota bacterium]|nr:response regulator transcription factor [Planctomycetota bacterium]